MSAWLPGLLIWVQVNGYAAVWAALFIAAAGVPLPISLVLLAVSLWRITLRISRRQDQLPYAQPGNPSPEPGWHVAQSLTAQEETTPADETLATLTHG